MSYATIRFGDLYAVGSRNGLTKPSKVRGSGYKMINMGELFANDRIYDIPMELVPLKETEKVSAKVEVGDLLFARQSLVLEGAGKCSIVLEVSPLTVFESHLIRVRLVDEANPMFYYYYFRSSLSPVQSIVSQCAQAGIRGSDLQELEVLFPPKETQDRIANVLEQYDNLIENNRKQIALLEEAAQRLYREYFVDLRFPGHEDVKVIDGVPEGWTRKTVLDCLEMSIGGGWGKESVVGRNVIAGKVIRGTDINDVKSGEYVNVPLRYHTENDTQKRALKANDIVFEISNGNIDNIGRSLLIDDLILGNCGENTICASFCKLFRPLDRLHALLLYLEIQDMNASGRMMLYKKQGSNGINNFAFNDFISHEVLVPNKPYHLLLIGRMIEKTSIVREQLSLLKQARDRLLPKLMSGEITV